MLKKIIKDASYADSDGDDDECTDDPKRVRNLKKQMRLVRGLAESWDELVDICVEGTEPYSVTIRKVLDVMCDSPADFRVADIICICTNVSDVCVSLHSKGVVARFTINDIIETTVGYILDRDIKGCREFLYFLENH